MNRLITLAAVLTLTLCCTVARSQAIQSSPQRPAFEIEFPPAEVVRVGGVEYRCFAADGESWKRVAHIVVDYRAFFAWGQWVDRTFVRMQAERNELSLQLSTAQELLTTSENSRAVIARLFDEEHTLRLQAEARLDNSTPRWLSWGLGGVALVEAGAIVALVAAGAAR